MEININELTKYFKSEINGFEESTKINPIPLGYDHFPSIDEMRGIGEILKIETEEDLYNWLSNASNLTQSDEKKTLYRGHADASWLTISTIYREAKKNDADFRRLEKSHHEYVKELLNNRQGISNNEQVLTYAQHYGHHSTLIDFTFNPLIALYFATTENFAENKDSDLQYYFSVIELEETAMFGNWEKALDISLKSILTDGDDRPEMLETFKSAMGNSVVEELQKIDTPVWIAEANGREISNPRMRAQEGAFLYQCKHADVPFEAEVKAIKSDPLKQDMIQIRYVLISRKLFLKVREILDDFRINAHSLLLEGPNGWIEEDSSRALKGFVHEPKAINLVNDSLYFLQYNPCPQSINLFRSSLYLAKIIDFDSSSEDVEWELCPWFTKKTEPELIDKIRYSIQFCIPDELLSKQLPQIHDFVNEIKIFCDELRAGLTDKQDLSKMINTKSVKDEFKGIVKQIVSYMELQCRIKAFISETLISVVDNAFSEMICKGDQCFNNGNQYGQLEEVDSIEILNFRPERSSLLLLINASASVYPFSAIHEEEAYSKSMEFTFRVRVTFENSKVHCEQVTDMDFE